MFSELPRAWCEVNLSVHEINILEKDGLVWAAFVFLLTEVVLLIELRRWSLYLLNKQFLVTWSAYLSRQPLQKVCWHGNTLGSWNSSVQMEQWRNSSSKDAYVVNLCPAILTGVSIQRLYCPSASLCPHAPHSDVPMSRTFIQRL